MNEQTSTISPAPMQSVAALPVVSKKSHPLRKVLVIVTLSIAFLVFIGIAIYYLFPQIWLTLLLHNKYPQDKYPILYTLPQSYQLVASEQLAPEVFSELGLSFQLPWLIVNRKTGQDILVALFAEDKSSIVLVQTNVKLLPELSPDPSQLAKLKVLLGPQSLQSEYSLANKILNTSLSQLSFTSSPNQAAAEVFAVTLKTGAVLNDSKVKKPILYSFSTGQIRGWKVIDPSNSSLVDISFYDLKDNRYDLAIRSPHLTEGDVDSILLSFKDI